MRRFSLITRPRALALLLCAAISHAAAEPKITPDVVYGHKDGLALTFDVVAPEQGANGAGVLFMVSGGWVSQWVPPEELARRFENLLEAGMTVFLVRHGSSPRFIMPEAVADVRRAVRFIRLNADKWNVDPERLGVFGGSAGGHLSLMLGLASDAGDPAAKDPVLRASSRVAAVVAYYPPVDLRVMSRGALAPQPGDPEWLVRPLELPALDFDPALAPEYSPILFVSSDDPPTLLVHGTKDELVPTEDSRRIHAALKEKGAATDLLILEGADHSFEGDDARRASEALCAWFVKHLGGKKKSAGAAPEENAMKPGEPRIPPLKEAEWTEGQRELLKARAGSGPLYNVFTTFATHEELYRQWIPFAGYILRGSTLAPRDRELAILRIGWLCKSEYEWGQHARLARGIGMSEEEIEGTTKDIAARAWSKEDAELLRAVDELHTGARIEDATWKALSARYNTKQMMDLVFTVGEYNLVSMALNSFGVQLDEGLSGFPK